jgi:hypothetical protein
MMLLFVVLSDLDNLGFFIAEIRRIFNVLFMDVSIHVTAILIQSHGS